MEDKSKRVTSIKSESNKIEKLSTLYEAGLESKAKIGHSRWYNFVIILLWTVIAVCIGITICYLIYFYCS